MKLKKLPTIIKTEDDLQLYVNTDLINMGIPFHHRKKGMGGYHRTANVFTIGGKKLAWPDNEIYLFRQRIIFVELKMPSKDLTFEQLNFKRWASKNGFPFYVIRSIEAWKVLKLQEIIQG
jgi:hypothetical protein